MPELLIELLSEEIPSRMQSAAGDELKRLFVSDLEDAGLPYENARAYVTPRRLALVVYGVPKRQTVIKESRRGPSVNAAEEAINGFARSLNLSREKLKTEMLKGGEYYVTNITRGGGLVVDILPNIVRKVVSRFSWPKSMAWGDDTRFKWVRPLKSVLCVFDGRPVKFDLIGGSRVNEDGGDVVFGSTHKLTSGNQTYGHRFLSTKKFKVTNFSEYKSKLFDAKVILDTDERRSRMEAELNRLASSEGLFLRKDGALLDEVVGLVEWPVALLGRIDNKFMTLPEDVLTTVMRRHQKYFSLVREDGTLHPSFVVVVNIEALDEGTTIVAGNERVLAARLSDAQFFWNQDRQRSLQSRVSDLELLIFHTRLGSVAQKVTRIQTLVEGISNYIPEADVDLAKEAALVAKSDLTTGVVEEFPELQGIMGGHYAISEGAQPEVALAISEHYCPLGPDDSCPSAPISITLALADKIDTLTGFWMIDEKPTGSRDPYALRRSALGVIRLIIENNIRLELIPIFRQALSNFTPRIPQEHISVLENDLMEFFAERLKVHLRGRGVRHDLINAVFTLGNEDDLVRLLSKVEALDAFLHTEDGVNLLTAFRRASNILRIEENRNGVTYNQNYELEELRQDEEKNLDKVMMVARSHVELSMREEDFSKAMLGLSKLRGPIDAFFDRVTVNTENKHLRENRFRMMSQIRTVMSSVADFSKIDG